MHVVYSGHFMELHCSFMDLDSSNVLVTLTPVGLLETAENIKKNLLQLIQVRSNKYV